MNTSNHFFKAKEHEKQQILILKAAAYADRINLWTVIVATGAMSIY